LKAIISYVQTTHVTSTYALRHHVNKQTERELKITTYYFEMLPFYVVLHFSINLIQRFMHYKPFLHCFFPWLNTTSDSLNSELRLSWTHLSMEPTLSTYILLTRCSQHSVHTYCSQRVANTQYIHTAHKVYHQSDSVHQPKTFLLLIPYKGKVCPKYAIKVQKVIGVYFYSFFNLGAGYGWMLNATPRPLYRDPLPTVQEAAWVQGPVWAQTENFAPTGIPTPDRPTRSGFIQYSPN
jgi:hypothetical protein